MRMILPTVRERRDVDRALRDFFTSYRAADFRRFITTLCRFYGVKQPNVEWYEYLDWGKGAGRTWDDGKIALVHPENWKRGRKYNSRRQWIHTVHHEMGHYLFWADAERKADLFADNMMQGVGDNMRKPPRSQKPMTRVRMTGTARSVARRRSAVG
jgi:hypothetical protein